ncbi:DUF4419 domain-containing protein [Chamaesiphon sp. OTE_75_metabat_556]|uniref:DUF4419 domain-containing protein n=1 Tax=Chamaesiphon sp. OTE_75_metabat_556 TaxID=2964692 RepID=UPI00286C6824|nr:DUF4419 domain-containing protein [Chamaesiphon sp. OTE_75_metabat_556]
MEDWQSIYDRVERMTQYNLKWWTDRLLPICQEFINTAAGEPSLEFWRCIYKPQQVYAADYITGWFADLFPYLQDPVTKAPTVRNKMLDVDRSKLPPIDNMDKLLRRLHDGIALHSLPLGLSQVACKVRVEGGGEYDLNLVAGFIGVRQDLTQGVLQPEIGWAVHRQIDSSLKSLDRIEQEYSQF